MRRAAAVALAALALAHLGLALGIAVSHSATFDEVVYPAAGWSYLTTRDYRMNPEHPPLLKLVSGAAWVGLGPDVETVPGWVEGNQWRFGRAALYDGDRDPHALLLRARAAIAVLSAGLVALTGIVAWRLAGPAAGVAAAALVAFDPLVLAHGALATTDLGAAALYFAAAIALPGAVERGGAGRTALGGLLVGLALAAKYSALPLVLLPFALAALVRGGARTRLRRAAAVLAVAAVTVAATYLGSDPLGYLRGLGMLALHDAVGHPAFAFGRYADHGLWWFFPAAWAVKTPLPILLASAAGVVAVAARRRRDTALVAVLIAAPALVVAAALASSLNLGVRHLLPITPFLAVAGGVAAAATWRRGVVGRVAVSALGAWLVAGTLGAYPHVLAYGNVLVGGPSGTWRALADSNVDWGQDLPALASIVRRRPLRRLYLAYFGTADPAADGLRYTSAPSMGMAPRRFEAGGDLSGRELLAVSVTTLHGVYAVRHDAWSWLLDRPAMALPGGSIGVWDITGDADAFRRLADVALRFGDADAAIPPLERLLELRPGDEEARAELEALRGQVQK